jgi:hypothetical protein
MWEQTVVTFFKELFGETDEKLEKFLKRRENLYIPQS